MSEKPLPGDPVRLDAPQVTSSLPLEIGSPAWIEACWQDMQLRAQTGEPFSAELYISRMPNSTPEQTADLVYAEFLLTRSSEPNVTTQQFLEKYPEAAEHLSRQFAIDDALSQLRDECDEQLAEDHSSNTLRSSELHADDTSTLVESPSLPLKSPHDSQIGERPQSIGRYVVVDRLSRGAQAEVFRAYDPQLKRDVVIKIEPRRESCSPSLFSGTEAIIAANLNHPNIAPALDAGEHFGRRFSVSRYVRGQTFDQWVRSGKPSPQEVAQLLAKIARGLANAHAQGTLHLDVKPQNILVDENQEPYLIDFGLSLVADAYQQDEIEDGFVRGTLQFMPPEQLRGEADQIGPCCDVFGLGATLFMGWVGRPPYDAPVIRQDLAAIEKGHWRRDLLEQAGLSEEMRSIVVRALAASCKDRYQTCADFASDLEQIALGPRPDTKGTIVENDGSGGLWKWASVVSMALLLVLAAVFWSTRPTLAPPVVPSSDHAIDISVGVDGGQFVELTTKVPLLSGDKLRFHGSLPAGQAAVLFTIAPDGTVDVLARFQRQDSDRTFDHPQDPTKAVPLTGGGGTEVIAIGLGDSLQGIDDALAAFQQSSEDLPLIPASVVLSLRDGEMLSLSGTESGADDGLKSRLLGKTRKLGEAVDIDPGLASLAERISRLADHFDQQGITIHAIAFRHLASAPDG